MPKKTPFALAVLPFFMSISAWGSAISVMDLHKAIDASGAGWRAAENSLTRLSEDERRLMLGSFSAPGEVGVFTSVEKERATGLLLPSSFDWRAKDGLNWITPVRHQGACGSCVAFAALGVMESQLNITSGVPGLDLVFSPQALFSCGGGKCNRGWWPEEASKFLASQGVPDEACARYEAKDIACSSVCADSKERSVRLVKWGRPTQNLVSFDKIKKALLQGPLMTTMKVYEDFFFYSSGIYKHVTGKVMGAHAISIVGYNSSQRYWIVRNSWGTQWGEDGFFRISWDDVSGLGADTWSYTVPESEGYLIVDGPSNSMSAGGVVELKARGTYPKTASIRMTLVGPRGEAVGTQLTPCDDPSNCSWKVDTRTWAEGIYEYYAVAEWGSGKTSTSEHESMVVTHAKAPLRIGYFLSSPESSSLSGGVEFVIHTQSGESDVSLDQLKFHVTRDGKELQSVTVTATDSEMSLRWDSRTVPNGRYDVWFSGSHLTSAGHVGVVSKRSEFVVRN